jgi:hypothetical protein
MATWLFGYLGGLRFSPKPLDGQGNDTGQLFNWHPLLITLAFPVLMAEAVLAYKTPLVPLKDRFVRSVLYAALANAKWQAELARLSMALVADTSPPGPPPARPHSKAYHFVLHTAALVCVVLGVVAAFKSHTLKRPAPTPNLYSVSSGGGAAGTWAVRGLPFYCTLRFS